MLLAKGTIGDAGNVLNQTIGGTGVSQQDVYGVSGTITKGLLSVIGIIFVILLLYAGFLWMTSGGNEEKISKAKNTIFRSVIGIAIVLSAYAITVFVLGALR